MSYNIDSVSIESGSLVIRSSDIRKLVKKHRGDLPEGCFLFDCEDAEDDEVTLERLSWQGEGSGSSFEVFQDHVVPCLRGEAVVRFTWEGGDSISVYRIKDGTMVEGRMQYVFGDSAYRCPYANCTFQGTDEEVDEHRATGVHDDQPQAGSNLRNR